MRQGRALLRWFKRLKCAQFIRPASGTVDVFTHYSAEDNNGDFHCLHHAQGKKLHEQGS